MADVGLDGLEVDEGFKSVEHLRRHYAVEKKVVYCSRCVMPSTRPRIKFNAEGVCNACLHAERKKKEIDWDKRWSELEALCDKHRRDDYFDCVVPCSGGKDGSYIAYRLRHDLDMHPLCVTFAPPLPTLEGRRNLDNFLASGFNHLHITPDVEEYRRLNRDGFINQGRPKHGSVTGLCVAPIRVAAEFNIPLVFYGEDGESEYGGVDSLAGRPDYGWKDLVDIYFSGKPPMNASMWWRFPTEEECVRVGLRVLHWSFFEDWDPYKHYEYSVDYMGFRSKAGRSFGTYTNYAQLDDVLQDFHVYMMFLKFGFGRATSDACIDVRRGVITRAEAVDLVNEFDGEFPDLLFPLFLDYMGMSEIEARAVFDSFANTDILIKRKGLWVLK